VDFDLAAYWAQSATDFVANLPQYHATLRVAPGVLPRLRYMMRYTHLGPPGPPDAAGWSTLDVQFQMEADAAAYIVGFGAVIEVLEPAELRDKVLHLAASVVAFYGGAPPAPPDTPGASAAP
jgi:predicted DNA-binding transcriptional regulator YafY